MPIEGAHMAKDTKQRILGAALDMFAERGYAATNVRELAESLGLAKSALYKHFDSKEAILDALIAQLTEYYDERFGSQANMPPTPASLDELRKLTLHQINFTLRDQAIIKIRKMLMQEQFRDERLAKLATAHFLEGLTGMYETIFAKMMEAGTLRQDDPALLSLEYVAPVAMLVQLSDREPARTNECMQRIEAHVNRFCGANAN